MTVKDIIKELVLWSPSDMPCNSDRIVIGDENTSVDKVCVCCIATVEVIKEAQAWGAQMLITHEPTFHDKPESNAESVAQKKEN